MQPLSAGMATVDLRTQIDMLQAKIDAGMLHPRRHPWKLLKQAAIRAWKLLSGHAVLPTSFF